MLRELIAEDYNRVEFKDLLNGKFNQGITNLFSNDDLVIVTEGTQGEKYIYVDRFNYSSIKKEISLEFILYSKVLYVTGSNAELHYNIDINQGINFTQIANESDIEVQLWREIAGQFLSKFREKYINYVIYLSMGKQDKYSPVYRSYIESNIDRIKKDQYEDSMLGIFEPMDIYENVWLNPDKGMEFTKIDIIKYTLNEKLIDELVEIYYDRGYINNERIMYIYLYNKLQEENDAPEVRRIKNKLKALKKAGKTANILVDDKWIKVENTLYRGELRETSSWSSYSIKDVKSIKFNGKILYEE